MRAVVIEAEVVAATDRALLLDLDDGSEPIWMPRSVVEDGEKLVKGDSGDFEIADWFAQKEGLG